MPAIRTLKINCLPLVFLIKAVIYWASALVKNQ